MKTSPVRAQREQPPGPGTSRHVGAHHLNAKNPFVLINNLQQLRHLFWVPRDPNCIPAQLPMPPPGAAVWGRKGCTETIPLPSTGAAGVWYGTMSSSRPTAGASLPHHSRVCNHDVFQGGNSVCRSRIQKSCLFPQCSIPPDFPLKITAALRVAHLWFGAAQEHQKMVYDVHFVPGVRRQEL